MYPNNVKKNEKNLPAGAAKEDAVDCGPKPFLVNIDKAAKQNQNYRRELWTGSYLQATVMSIPCSGDIGLELHTDVDQFIRVEDGMGLVEMGRSPKELEFRQKVDGRYAVFVPAGTWHNVTNIGNRPLKLYTIYAPPHHPKGTVHPTKETAEQAEKDGHS